ncbi:hypothetical protein PR003_g10096 [Phytophthora rubi]|uniref:DDE-1 domain-containing protein n=1 Tax=Phytophthora rubi TaxID=129364 RepID=A0A6A3MXI0_9STRA|nr:hypothetical protein PR001_g9094 [Phytophthora rubi]KAE9341217.1 hypothetical protein PR003_g10096 [Phytophthora rubi]
MGAWMRIHQKRNLIQKAYECPTMTQHELGAWAKVAFKLKRAPAQTTILEIFRKAPAILSEAYGDGKCRKPLELTSLALEEKLWVDPGRRGPERVPLAGADHKPTEPSVREVQLPRVAQFLLQTAAAGPYRPICPHGVFNMDETGLCYAMAPARSICTRSARRVKKTKIRITIALTANADGSDALPPLFLGRAKQSYCFKKRSASQLGFEYKANQKAWMTGQVFREWLLNRDRDMRAAGRTILLLVDNASSHYIGEIVCTNVRLEFLPPNTTAFLQPMDAGIIAEFKRAYRRKQLRWVYDKIKRAEQIKKGDVYKVDQLQAMKWSKEIWQELQGKATIENCFRHTGIVFNGVDERSKKETSYSLDVEVEDIILRTADLHLSAL